MSLWTHFAKFLHFPAGRRSWFGSWDKQTRTSGPDRDKVKTVSAGNHGGRERVDIGKRSFLRQFQQVVWHRWSVGVKIGVGFALVLSLMAVVVVLGLKAFDD